MGKEDNEWLNDNEVPPISSLDLGYTMEFAESAIISDTLHGVTENGQQDDQ